MAFTPSNPGCDGTAAERGIIIHRGFAVRQAFLLAGRIVPFFRFSAPEKRLSTVQTEGGVQGTVSAVHPLRGIFLHRFGHCV